MPKSIEPADRRPLVYGIFALVILVAASYLFWPRSPKPDSLVLTPESVRTEAAAADMQTDPTSEEVAAVETVDVATDEAIAEETSITDEPPATVPATPPARTTPRAVQETAELSGSGPAGSGDWVLNVGAFSSESSARARAQEISREGMSAHVHRITADGKTLWRVRVGYFASKAKATEYGQWMKSTHRIEGWAGPR